MKDVMKDNLGSPSKMEARSEMTFDTLLDWHREYHACLCDLMESRDERLLSEKTAIGEGSRER